MHSSLHISALLSLAVQLAVVFGLIAAGSVALGGRLPANTTGKLAVGIAAYAAAGWVSFWLYFAHRHAGEVFSVVAMLGAVWGLRGILRHRDLVPTFFLMAAAGVFYVSMLLMFPADTFNTTAATRFIARMPGDNEIPRIFAERLSIGMSPKAIGGDWLSSDRPPLQSGLALLAWPLLRPAGVSMDVAFATAGVAFQLLWIPAMWSLLRVLGLKDARAFGATALLVFTGFIAFNSVFVWPKLGAAALVLLGYCHVRSVAPGARARGPGDWILTGVLLGLANFSHGGVMFSILALLGLGVWFARQARLDWLWAVAAFLVIALPWSAYQRFYEPPGNRLLKWHLAGVIPPDPRSFTEALFESYRATGWAKAAEARVANGKMLFAGGWSLFNSTDSAARYGRRLTESAYLLRVSSLWILALAAAPWAFWRLRANRAALREHAMAAGWLLVTVVLWVALMFIPQSVFVHQGSYVVPLLMLGLLASLAMMASDVVFVAVAAIQAVLFFVTWTEAAPPSAAQPQFFPVAMATFAAVLIVVAAGLSLVSPGRVTAGSHLS